MEIFGYFHVYETWYKENELVNNTSGPDISTVVSVPQDVCNLERDLCLMLHTCIHTMMICTQLFSVVHQP